MAKFKSKIQDCRLMIKVKLSLKEKYNQTQLELFSDKYIRGLLKVKTVKKNMIEYYGPIGISLYERMKKPISKYDFLFIMEQIVDIVQKVEANKLLLQNVIFDIQYVYINETTKELQFIYLPMIPPGAEVNMIGFLESIIYASTPMQEKDMEYISRFVYFIRSLKGFDANKIEQFIRGEDRSVVNTIKRHNVGQSGLMTEKSNRYNARDKGKDSEATGLLYEEEETDLLADGKATGLLADGEATGLLADGEETGLLADGEAKGLLADEEETGILEERGSKFAYAILYRYLTQEDILIDKPVFRIGKEKSYADYFVSNNDKVSRSHADIITRGQRFFIMDLNSSNKTYVNNKMIPAQQEIEIFSGDQIRLANEEFEFRV